MAAAAVAALPPDFAPDEAQLQLMEALVDLSFCPGRARPGPGSVDMDSGSDVLSRGSSDLAASLAAAAAASLLNKASEGMFPNEKY